MANKCYEENPLLEPHFIEVAGNQVRLNSTIVNGSLRTEIVTDKNNVSSNSVLSDYLEKIKIAFDLSLSGYNMFKFALNVYQREAHSLSTVYLHYDDMDKYFEKIISLATFNRGIRELISKRIIAKCFDQNVYWINPHFFVYGAELAIVTKYN